MRLRTDGLLTACVLLTGPGVALAAQGTCHEGVTPAECTRRLEAAEGREELQAGEEVRTAGEAPRKNQTVGESVSSAASEVARPFRGMGVAQGDWVYNTLTTDPISTVLGEGLNAQYVRALSRKFSGVIGASYGSVNVGTGRVNQFGATVGADYFIYGQRNEGLRIGPRLNLGIGHEGIGESDTFASLAADGELGYNFIARNGLTAGLAGGIGVLGGGLNDPADPEANDVRFDSYAKVNLGYSW